MRFSLRRDAKALSRRWTRLEPVVSPVSESLTSPKALGLSLVFWIWHRGLFAAP